MHGGCFCQSSILRISQPTATLLDLTYYIYSLSCLSYCSISRYTMVMHGNKDNVYTWLWRGCQHILIRNCSYNHLMWKQQNIMIIVIFSCQLSVLFGENEESRLIQTNACPGSWTSLAEVEVYLALK